MTFTEYKEWLRRERIKYAFAVKRRNNQIRMLQAEIGMIACDLMAREAEMRKTIIEEVKD